MKSDFDGISSNIESTQASGRSYSETAELHSTRSQNDPRSVSDRMNTALASKYEQEMSRQTELRSDGIGASALLKSGLIGKHLKEAIEDAKREELSREYSDKLKANLARLLEAEKNRLASEHATNLAQLQS